MTSLTENIAEKQVTETRIFYIKGMHCAACEVVIEDNLSKHEKVVSARAYLTDQKVHVVLNEPSSSTNLISEFNTLIGDYGYSIHAEAQQEAQVNFKDQVAALAIASTLIALFIALQKLGIIRLPNTNQITLPLVFIIGIIASLSSCVAVVGGMVLSISSTYAKANYKNVYTALAKFHVARLIAFFILGGLMGLIGSAFTLSLTATVVLNIILFFVMFILGLNLLNLFPKAKKFQIQMPKGIMKLFKTDNDSYLPIALGVSTFFLPCGFTQSMQIYSLTTGNFISGALTMLIFALGTLPVLVGISIASIKFGKSLKSELFFKTAGFIIIFLAFLNLINALVTAGIIDPIAWL